MLAKRRQSGKIKSKEPAMPERYLPRGLLTQEYRQTLHELNRRYQEAWDRAERLQDELDDIKKSRPFRLLSCWRRLTRLWRAHPGPEPELHRLFPTEILENQQVAAVGTVSILIPFKDRLDLLRNCLRGLRRGSYPDRE